MSEKKILIVDDDKFNQEVLQIRLEMLECEVVVLDDGDEAVKFIKDGNKVDLIYMDINMARLDGDKATIQIRAHEKKFDLPHTVIIAAGASIYEQDKERLLKCGMDDIIIKPIEQDELEESLARYVFKTKILEYDMENASKGLMLPLEKFAELLKKFTLSIEEELPTLVTLGEAKDFDGVRLLAHKLKGRAGNFQVMQMYDTFALIENRAKQGEEVEYKELADEVLQLNESLKKL